MNNWFSITNKSADEADIHIYDQIGGFGISADSFVKELKAVKAGTINVHMNTPGGGVFEGTAIYNALKAHPAKVIVHIDGIAASIGSIVAMAGDEIRIAKNAFMMIHDPAGLVFGSAADMRKMADSLEKMKGSLAGTYADRAGKSKKHWMEAMSAETWYDADEAVEAGLADSIIDASPEDLKIAAFDPSIFNNIPDPLRERWVKFQNSHGPKVAQSNAPVTATITKEHPMNLEAFNAYAAEHPEAVSAFVAKGKQAGIAEATASEVNRLKGLTAACPNRPQLAIDSFIAGRNADETKATVDALDAEAKAAAASLLAAKVENERLQGIIDLGGHAGVPLKPKGQTEENPAPPSDPVATAKADWAANKDNCQGNFLNEKVFVAFRKAEANNQIRASKQR